MNSVHLSTLPLSVQFSQVQWIALLTELFCITMQLSVQSVHSAQYCEQFCAVYSTVYSEQCIVYSVQYTVQYSTVNNIQYSVQCICTVHFSVHSTVWDYADSWLGKGEQCRPTGVTLRWMGPVWPVWPVWEESGERGRTEESHGGEHGETSVTSVVQRRFRGRRRLRSHKE